MCLQPEFLFDLFNAGEKFSQPVDPGNLLLCFIEVEPRESRTKRPPGMLLETPLCAAITRHRQFRYGLQCQPAPPS